MSNLQCPLVVSNWPFFNTNIKDADLVSRILAESLKTCLNPPRGRGGKQIGALASEDGSHYILHSKKCNIRLPYVKHALNVRYKRYVKLWIEHHTFNVFFTIRYTCVLKKHALNARVEKHAFYHPLKSLMLTYYNQCIKILFLETYV